MAFVYVTIERDDEPSWLVTLGNRDEALAFIEEINRMTEDVWQDSYENFAHLVGEWAHPTAEEARGRIVKEINELADVDDEVERVE